MKFPIKKDTAVCQQYPVNGSGLVLVIDFSPVAGINYYYQ